MRYSISEDTTIIINLPMLTHREISALLPGRTTGSVSSRIHLLGLGGPRGRNPYTAAEEQVLRDNAGTLTARQIAELLPGRDRQSVKQKAWWLRVSLKLK